jgi:ATP-dependent Lhr-like helicase
MAGDIFLLGTHSWQIRRVEAGVVRVRDAGDAPPTVPFWTGEAPARTKELSEEISALRARVDELLTAHEPDAARAWLIEHTGIDREAAGMIVDYLAVGRAVLGVTPTLDTIVLERFFDETGGMQLVVHSPYGARINRAFGLALRKKFCRTFNFELQAAATDNAIVLSLGPHHSFPLEEVPRYVSSHSVEETLQQAVLDAPMFISRWRWNLNRALLVLRFRGGRRNPPPIQRMEADDLMAAIFPQAAACQENVVGPIEIPDHLIVRQTMYDTLHEALDVDGLRDLMRAIEGGTVQVHTVDSTEPSVLAHEILTARPYAFLDDEELQNRRTNAVTLRRGLSVDLAAIGQLERDAIARVHEEITPRPETADDLHDLLCSLVLTRPRPEWDPLFDELRTRGRAQVIGDGFWCATEVLGDAERVWADDDAAVVAVVRGHLELAGITTHDALATTCGVTEPRVKYALAVLEQEGAALRGSYTGTHSVEWVSRRLLVRMHAYSRRTRRRGVEPVTAQDFMRFLLRWQHLAPGTQLVGDAGLATIVGQLQGWEAAAAAWEPELIGRRLRKHDPVALDRLCHDGEVTWLRLSPRTGENDAPVGPPSKATPIAVLFRDDLHWLLETARFEADPIEPPVGATAEIVDALRVRGACFASELCEATNRLPEDVERGLWAGVTRGLLSSDGFNAIRRRVDKRSPTPAARGEAARLSRLLRGGRPRGSAAGRWALVPAPNADLDREELAEATAELLLRRWGVVFRDLVQRESIRLPWRDLQRALRRLEDRGLVRGGRFVSGFAGEQFALPEAVEQLTYIRKLPRTGERVTVNATDPCNLVGLVVPGDRVASIRARRIVYVDGIPCADAS